MQDGHVDGYGDDEHIDDIDDVYGGECGNGDGADDGDDFVDHHSADTPFLAMVVVMQVGVLMKRMRMMLMMVVVMLSILALVDVVTDKW